MKKNLEAVVSAIVIGSGQTKPPPLPRRPYISPERETAIDDAFHNVRVIAVQHCINCLRLHGHTCAAETLETHLEHIRREYANRNKHPRTDRTA